jgi:hypothetical protein
MTPFSRDNPRPPTLKAVIWKLFLGSMVILAMVGLALSIALGQVHENSSYGLIPVMSIIGKFVLDFSEWAFRGSRMSDELGRPEPPKAPVPPEEPPPPPA